MATGKLAWHFQYTPNDSWEHDEVGVHLLYYATIDGVRRKVVSHFGRNGFFYSLDRTNGKFIKAQKYVNDLNWTKGIHPETGRPLDYNPKIDVQIYNPEARALRGDGKKRACPTWHGGVAHQPLAFNPVKNIAYGVGTEGCFTQNGAAVASASKDGGIDVKASQTHQYSSDLYYGAVTPFDPQPQGRREGVTDIEFAWRDRDGRRTRIHGAAGRMGRRLQRRDARGVVAIQRGHAAQGGAGHLRDRKEQYLAVQSGGRHLHPVNWDKLQNSSYLFVFALN